MKASLNVGSSIQSTMKDARRSPSGQIIGQNGAECHNGTMREPEALQLRITMEQ